MLFEWLRRKRQSANLGHLRLVVYTRKGCHLCDTAGSRLEEFRQRYGFSVETVDVDTDPELQAQYGDTVPVVTVNGKVRFKGCVNVVLLKRLLEAEAGKRESGGTGERESRGAGEQGSRRGKSGGE